MDMLRKCSHLARRWSCFPSGVKTGCRSNSHVPHRNLYSRHFLKSSSTTHTVKLYNNKSLGCEISVNGYHHKHSSKSSSTINTMTLNNNKPLGCEISSNGYSPLSPKYFNWKSQDTHFVQSSFETVLVVGSIAAVIKALTKEEEINNKSNGVELSDIELNGMNDINKENYSDKANKCNNYEMKEDDSNNKNDKFNNDSRYDINKGECGNDEVTEDEINCNGSNIEKRSIISDSDSKENVIEQKDTSSHLVSGNKEKMKNGLINQAIDVLLAFLKVMPTSISKHKKMKNRNCRNKRNKKVHKRRMRRIRENRERNKC